MLTVTDVTGGYGKVSALHEVGLTVGDREIVAIVGPNGAGKSTLVKAIMRQLADVSGSITFDDIQLDKRRPSDLSKLGIGYVPQGGNTFPDLTVEENLRVAVRNGVRGTDVATALTRTFERFPALEPRRKQYASTLSGGERQMLAVGAAMAIEPTLLLLDRPTTGLAPRSSTVSVRASVPSAIRARRSCGWSRRTRWRSEVLRSGVSDERRRGAA